LGYKPRLAARTSIIQKQGRPPPVPPLNSLKKFIPPDHLWPIDEVWNFHAGSSRFKNLEKYNAALSAQYGPPKDLDDYNRKSQAMAYDGERAMFEAYSRNKYKSTGVIQWMLNNAWPSLQACEGSDGFCARC